MTICLISVPPKRVKYIDLGAGLMILWMIIGHAIYAASSVEILRGESCPLKGISYFIPNFLFFFMPWFFYKSGQFFRKNNLRDKWKKDFQKLLCPFLIWSGIGFMLYVILQILDNTLTLRSVTYDVLRSLFIAGNIQLNTPLWFLLTLFMVRQIANYLLPHEEDRFYWLKSVFVILGGYGIAFGMYSLNSPILPLWIGNGAAGLAFFTLGYCMSRYEKKLWLIVPCTLCYVVCCILEFPNYDMRSNWCGSAILYLLNFPACFAGIVTFNMFCRLIARCVPYVSMPFEIIGKFAMIIYVSHGLIFESIRRLIPSLCIVDSISFSIVFWLIMGAYVVLLPLFCYFDYLSHERIRKA